MTVAPTPIPIDPADPGKVLDALQVGSLVVEFRHQKYGYASPVEGLYGLPSVGLTRFVLTPHNGWMDNIRTPRRDIHSFVRETPASTWLAFAAVTQ